MFNSLSLWEVIGGASRGGDLTCAALMRRTASFGSSGARFAGHLTLVSREQLSPRLAEIGAGERCALRWLRESLCPMTLSCEKIILKPVLLTMAATKTYLLASFIIFYH